MANGIGKRLSDARAERGIELAEAQERIKIRAHYLRAMEDERWDLLPGTAYARGFLRTYGDFLGLDGSALVDQFERVYGAEHGEVGAERVRQITPSGHPGLTPPARPPGRPFPGWTAIGAISVAVIVGILLALGLTQGSEDESGGHAQQSPSDTTGASTETTAATTTAEPPARVTLRVTATGTVWVCLVDDSGAPVIEGVTLLAGDEEGPFRARAFDVTFGNGQVEMEANGEPVDIPAAAEPLGYRVTPDKTSELPEGSRPTCT